MIFTSKKHFLKRPLLQCGEIHEEGWVILGRVHEEYGAVSEVINDEGRMVHEELHEEGWNGTWSSP